MKRLILSILMVGGMAIVAGAQTGGDQGTGGNHTANSSSGTSGRSIMAQKGKKGKKVAINERMNYQSPKTGQTATYTGQQATSVNGTNSGNPKIATRKE